MQSLTQVDRFYHAISNFNFVYFLIHRALGDPDPNLYFSIFLLT